ncbi:MAG: AsmA family protein [Desulfobulbales bacterium]
MNSMGVSFMPPSISAKSIEIYKNGSKISHIETLRVNLNLSSLIKGLIQIKDLQLIKPEFVVTRLENGAWNIMLPEHKEIRLLLPQSLNFKDGTVILRDGNKFLEVRGISLTARDISLADDRDLPMFARFSVGGIFSFREMKWDKIVLRDFKSDLTGFQGNYLFEPIIFRTLGGMATGRVEANMGSGSPRFVVHLQLDSFKLEDFFTSLSEEELVRGGMDLEIQFTTSGESQQELLRSVSGNVDMTGQNLVITKVDLDTLLEEYLHSQQFDLVDLGAFAVIGPLGPALTKSYDLSGVLSASKGGTTKVRQLVSLWRINDGKVTANDVAFATQKNRIVVSGAVDIIDNKFRHLLVTVVDVEGCAVISQEMNGPIDNPKVKEATIIKSTIGPFINLIKKGARTITMDKCETIYNGSVAPPSE